MEAYIPILIVIAIILIIIISCIKVVPQAQVYVIERFGAYRASWQTGLHFLIPFIDRGFYKRTGC